MLAILLRAGVGVIDIALIMCGLYIIYRAVRREPSRQRDQLKGREPSNTGGPNKWREPQEWRGPNDVREP